MKTKRVLINKERKQIQKRRRRTDARNSKEIFLHQYSNAEQRVHNGAVNLKREQFPVSPHIGDVSEELFLLFIICTLS